MPQSWRPRGCQLMSYLVLQLCCAARQNQLQPKLAHVSAAEAPQEFDATVPMQAPTKEVRGHPSDPAAPQAPASCSRPDLVENAFPPRVEEERRLGRPYR